MAHWIRPQTLNHEVPGSNLPAAASSALGQGTLSSLPSPRKGLKAIGPLVACLQAAGFLGGQVK